ncbi:TPA: hypothetical protein HA278_00735 [Candidatus Woesearchaeota archaeon]|nr:hypothetical protein [Candidatus Woesearchaeota archaeon]
MKLLRQTIRKLILEQGMKTPADLGPYRIRIQDISQDIRISIVGQPRTGMLSLGHIDIRKAGNNLCDNAWEVVKSRADHGWGPLLYDVAMETVGKDGLMCDRQSVSKPASRVWDFYLQNRTGEGGDIEAVQLDYVRRPFVTPDDPSDDCPQYSFLRWAHDDLDAAGHPKEVYHFDPKKVPEHEEIYKDHWATKKYVRKDRQTPTLDALKKAGKLEDQRK